MENRFDRQEQIENEENIRSRDSARHEEINDNQEEEDYVYKKQLRQHDAREQIISRKLVEVHYNYDKYKFFTCESL